MGFYLPVLGRLNSQSVCLKTHPQMEFVALAAEVATQGERIDQSNTSAILI